MEKFNIEHSLKDIPIPSKQAYLTRLLKSIEDVIGRMRWKTHFFLNGTYQKGKTKENYGFKTVKTPPKHPLMMNFENDLTNMIRNVEFSNQSSKFQKGLNEEVKMINNSTEMLVKADKTRNIYKVDTGTYKKLMKDSLTTSYKKLNSNNNNENLEYIINKEAKSITDKLKISNRVCKLRKKDCYLLLKDHKPDFINKIAVRLINPTRTEIGKISKTILERCNKQITNKLQLQQWISTKDAIDWFNRIDNKQKAAFVQFDITDFYPSITEEILETAMDFAQTYSDLNEDDWEIIKHCRKTLVCNNGEQWIKKNGGAFDVPMGSLDSAQVSDLVGLLILYNITKHTDITKVGLYRDDGLMVVDNANGHKCDKARKFITKELKELGFKAEIISGIKIVNFLDVTLNLTNSTYSPFIKENHIPRYINTRSNHPPSIIKKIPHSIESRISRNSSSKEIFDKNSKVYSDALRKSGHSISNLNFVENAQETNNRKRKRIRNLIWFTPPYNIQVKTNIGKTFLSLIKKHFHKDNILSKIFNKNKIKVGYSCFDSIDRIIKKHNSKILARNNRENLRTPRKCDCRNKPTCPLNNNCQIKSVVYQAEISTVEDPSIDKIYIGIASTTFKARYGNHKHSFKNHEKRNNTALSTFYWDLKQENLTPKIKWKVLMKASICSDLHGPCNLCLSERLSIINAKDINKVLNKRSEIAAECPHRWQLQLNNPKNTN